MHFLLFKLWEFAALGGINQDQPLGYCLLQAVAQKSVDAAYHSRAEAFVLQCNLVVALDPSALLEVVVESLDLDSRQLLQFDTADLRDDVVVDVVLVV